MKKKRNIAVINFVLIA